MLFYLTENIRELKNYIRKDENSEIIYPNEVQDIVSRYEFIKALIEDSSPDDVHEYNKLLSGILGVLGSISYRASDFDKARDYVMEKMELDESLHDIRGLARCYSLMGNLYLNFGDIPRAIGMHLKRLDICRKLQDKKGIAISLTNIGNCEMINQNFEESLKYNIEAVEVYQELNQKDSRFASILGNLGQSHYYLQNYDEALKYLHKSLDIKKDNDDYSRSNALTMMGCAYIDNRKYDKGFEYFSKALESAKKFGDKNAELTILLALANTHQRLGNIDKALETLHKTLEENVNYSDDINYSALYYALYECYKIKKNFESAFRYFSQYWKLNEKIDLQSSERIISNLKNLHELENIRIYNKAKSLRNDQLKFTLDKLEKVNAELSRTNKEKNELLSVIAHDLRNPVSNIKLIADMNFSGEQSEKSGPDEFRDTELMTATCEDILNILTDLVEPGSKNIDSKIKYTSFDIIKLLKRSIVLFNLNASSKKLDIRLLTLDDELYIKSDYRSVYQIIDNLISNSIKFSPKDSAIEIKVQRSKNSILLTFKDKAGGFSEENIKKYFGESSGSISYKDVNAEGFGLSIVNKLLSNIRGKITCTNVTENEMKGSMIEVTIPDNTISIL